MVVLRELEVWGVKWWRRLWAGASSTPAPVRKCGVQEDDWGTGATYWCTLRAGHGGLNHETWAAGVCLHRWPRWLHERLNDSPR